MSHFITILIIVLLMIAVFCFMWRLSKLLVLPLQLVLFILLIVVVTRVFVNKENAEKLHEEVSKSKIPEIEKKVFDLTGSSAADAVNVYKDDDAKEEPAPQPSKAAAPKANSNSGEINFVDML